MCTLDFAFPSLVIPLAHTYNFGPKYYYLLLFSNYLPFSFLSGLPQEIPPGKAQKQPLNIGIEAVIETFAQFLSFFVER